MPVQSGKCSERNRYNPEEQNICYHQKTSIPTAPEHTLCHYSVDRLKYNNQCNRIHKLPCNLLCFRCNIIKPDYIRTDQQNNPCSACPHNRSEPQKGPCLLLRFFLLSASKCMPGDNAPCMTDSLNQNRTDLLNHRRN